MKLTSKVRNQVTRGTHLLEPRLILISSGPGLLVKLVPCSAVDTGFSAASACTVAEGVSRIFGHSLSFAIRPPSILVPSTVPLLRSEYLAHFATVMCCSCCTKPSRSFSDAGFHGSASFCVNVKLEKNDAMLDGHVTLFEHDIRPPSLLHLTF